uniref:Uncharacterized protein n=1 Tax=Naja naja TaxID=35670 RepID=A0A8C6XIH9_NAJNA
VQVSLAGACVPAPMALRATRAIGSPSRLRFVFGTSVVPALDLVDRQSVTRFVSPSGRTVYQVVGSSGKLYTCYASCHFCSCPAFAFSVLRKGDNLVVTKVESLQTRQMRVMEQQSRMDLGWQEPLIQPLSSLSSGDGHFMIPA